ncbi:hypothetical protein L1987_57917 [Smallanthus sonchifolius]|uniref:Uncharacterized protein n=1 Tax=Smallanthus sonchifolius TaxID=185202 RepID=A0ACB9DDW6_9ASTR|nr:hypothetical protein L1987_57917 [Smallanthus sonchifolius]
MDAKPKVRFALGKQSSMAPDRGFDSDDGLEAIDPRVSVVVELLLEGGAEVDPHDKWGELGSINIKEFDKCIAMPQLMPQNRERVNKAKKNITFKKDKSAIFHVGIGKVSFTEEALCENVDAFVNGLLLGKCACHHIANIFNCCSNLPLKFSFDHSKFSSDSELASVGNLDDKLKKIQEAHIDEEDADAMICREAAMERDDQSVCI